MAELVETTTYEIASDALFHKPLLPEERLWRSVIINALEDTQIIHSDRKIPSQNLKPTIGLLATERTFKTFAFGQNYNLMPSIIITAPY